MKLLLTFISIVVAVQSNSYLVPLKGKTVLVTGASSGIGEAISKEFATHGLNVVLTARRKENLHRILGDIKKAGGTAIAVATDVNSKESVSNAFKVAEEAFGPVHFTVANAGFGGEELPIENDRALEAIEATLQTNLFGVIYTLRSGIISSRKSGGGAIVLVSSPFGALPAFYFTNMGFGPMTNLLSYGASKAALDSLARSSAGFAKENIRVYSLAPFVFHSEAIQAFAEKNGIEADQFAAVLNPFFPQAGNPRDLAPVMLSLFDNSTLYAPGSVVYCDHHVTFSGDVIYPQTPLAAPLSVPRSQARDFRGNPYIWPEEKQDL